jgi:hypothetical protein
MLVQKSFSLDTNRPGPAAFPAGPRGGPRDARGKPSTPAAREIAARESGATAFSRPVQTNAISRVPSGNASGPGLTPRLLPRREPWRRVRLPLAAMSEEHGKVELQPWRKLRRAIQRRPGFDFGGRAGACRRGRRPGAGAVPRKEGRTDIRPRHTPAIE